MRSSSFRYTLIAFACLLLAVSGCSSSSSPGPNNTTLLSVVAVSRHGIRSPVDSQATMNLYTTRPQSFPLWPSPPEGDGTLSTWGHDNVARLGSWYRDFYGAQGVFPPRGTCPGAGAAYFYADNIERTLDTAQGYIDGIFQSDSTPGCGLPVNHTTLPVDPYIHTPIAEPSICKIDTASDLVVFNKLIGGSPAALMQGYSRQLDELQDVTQCCQPAACATASNPSPASCTLKDLPTTINTSGLVNFAQGPLFDVADTLTETFELEYAQGMTDPDCALTSGAPCVAWVQCHAFAGCCSAFREMSERGGINTRLSLASGQCLSCTK